MRRRLLPRRRPSHEDAVQQIANQRAAAARELQKAKDRLTERDKSLKAINTALADTPENLLKKMNTLKKQKQEEADARRQVESVLNALRTEKRQQDEKSADVLRNGATLVSRYRDLRALALKLHEQLQPLVEDAKSLPEIPELDTDLLEAIEQPADQEFSNALSARAAACPRPERGAAPYPAQEGRLRLTPNPYL